MYTELLKALYGTLDAELILWSKLSTDLDRRVFKMNWYDWCITDKDIKGKQCEIPWIVNDIK